MGTYAPAAGSSTKTTLKIRKHSMQEILRARFEVRRSSLGAIIRELRTNDLDDAAGLFFTFKAAQDAHINLHPASAYMEMDDVETFCVWDNDTMNVAFHEGRYLTTYLLKEETSE